MKVVHVELSEALAEAAQLNHADPSTEAARLLALELFPKDKVSLGRAAELCQMPIEAFMESPLNAKFRFITVSRISKPTAAHCHASGSDSRFQRISTNHPGPSRPPMQVITGKGMPGATVIRDAVKKDDRVRVSTVHNANEVERMAGNGLGSGEVAAIVLAQELSADPLLMDERKGRKFASEKGLAVAGCIAILEELHRLGHITDLRAT